MKKIFSVMFAVVFLLFLFVDGVALAQKFHENGFEIDVKWKQKHKSKLDVWGTIKGNKKCSQLNVSISFDNTKKSTAIGWVETYVKDYRPNSERRFKVTDKINGTSKMKKHWFVDSVYIKCHK